MLPADDTLNSNKELSASRHGRVEGQSCASQAPRGGLPHEALAAWDVLEATFLPTPVSSDGGGEPTVPIQKALNPGVSINFTTQCIQASVWSASPQPQSLVVCVCLKKALCPTRDKYSPYSSVQGALGFATKLISN